MIKPNIIKKIAAYAFFAVILFGAGFLALNFFGCSSAGQSNGEENKAAAEARPELSQIGGKEILDLLLVLQQIKLDVCFFRDEKFSALRDFYKEIKISEEEKGNS